MAAADWHVLGFYELGPALDPKKPALEWKMPPQSTLSVYKNWFNEFYVFLTDVGGNLSELQAILMLSHYKPQDKNSPVFKAGESLYIASQQFVKSYPRATLTREHVPKILLQTEKHLKDLHSALNAMLAAPSTHISKKEEITKCNTIIKKFASQITPSIEKLGEFSQVNNTDLIITLATKN